MLIDKKPGNSLAISSQLPSPAISTSALNNSVTSKVEGVHRNRRYRSEVVNHLMEMQEGLELDDIRSTELLGKPIGSIPRDGEVTHIYHLFNECTDPALISSELIMAFDDLGSHDERIEAKCFSYVLEVLLSLTEKHGNITVIPSMQFVMNNCKNTNAFGENPTRGLKLMHRDAEKAIYMRLLESR